MTKYVFRYLLKYKVKLCFLLTTLLVTAAISIFVPYFNGVYLDMLIADPTIERMVQLTILMISVGLIGMMLSFCAKLLAVKICTIVEYDITADLVEHMQKIPYCVYMNKFNNSQLLQRITTDVHSIVSLYLNNISQFVFNAFILLFLASVLFSISKTIFLVIAVFIPVYLCIYICFKKPLFASNYLTKEANSIYFKTLFDQLYQLQSIKADASFEQSRVATKTYFSHLFRVVMSNTKLVQWFSSADSFLSILFQGSVLLIGGSQIISGIMTVGELTVVNAYFTKVLEALKFYFTFGQTYQNAKASYERIQELNQIEEEHNGEYRLSSLQTIQIKDLSFSYENSTFSIDHRNKTTSFEKGYVYLINGQNGSGKTTYINILLGLIQEISSGYVKYNGFSLENLDLYAIRKDIISVLLQDTLLPDDTASNYLSTGLAIDNDSLVCEIFKSGLNILYKDKNHLTTLLGERLNNLSGGERQLISLTRVFLKKSDVFVLDEPSTALDKDCVERLIKYIMIAKKDKIIILTSHDNRLGGIIDQSIDMQ